MAKQTQAKPSARADLSSPQSARGNAKPVPKRTAKVTPAAAKPTGKPGTKSAPAKSKKAGPVGTTTAAAKKATSKSAAKSTPKATRSGKAVTGDTSSQTAKQGAAKPAKPTAKKATGAKASAEKAGGKKAASKPAAKPAAGKPSAPAKPAPVPTAKPKPTPAKRPADDATRIRLSAGSPAGDEVELKPVAEGLTNPAGETASHLSGLAAKAASSASGASGDDDAPAVLHRPDRMTSDSAPRKNRAGLGARDLDHFRRLLLDKRAELTGDLTSMEREALQHGDSHQSGPLADTADLGTDAYEQEFTLGLVEKERQVLREINEALAKLHDGSYGVCEGTGEPIGRPRLEAKPWAKYSIDYARKMEKPGFRR